MDGKPSTNTSDELHRLTITTFVGAFYAFPCMPDNEIAHFEWEMTSPGVSNITIRNVHGAVLVLPRRVVKEAMKDDELIWPKLNPFDA